MTTRSAATNSPLTYGWVERAFHWSIALLIALNVALGFVADWLPFASDTELARKALAFSLHKTVGVTIFLVAVARILWAATQPRPRPLHDGWERRLAATVHWLLYGSLVVVPLLGWAQHAAAEGFAPILWPFGQSLPFVPKDPGLERVLSTLHVTFVWVLIGAVALHATGAAKHVVVDRDLTLARMLRGAEPGPLPARGPLVLPLVAAGAVALGALGVGLASVPDDALATSAAGGDAALAPAAGGIEADVWTVEEGTLSLTVAQMGAPVTGRFEDWDAAIRFDPQRPGADGALGDVEVAVATGSVTLGSVSEQARAPDFLSSEAFPTAVFRAAILPEGEGYVAEGTLSLRGVEVPLRLPFMLSVTDGVAEMEGQAVVDRRDFGMGETYPDESSVGFAVTLDIALRARRSE